MHTLGGHQSRRQVHAPVKGGTSDPIFLESGNRTAQVQSGAYEFHNCFKTPQARMRCAAEQPKLH